MIDTRVAVERSVLGGLLTFPRVWDDLQLVADYFGDALNRLIFERIQFLRGDGVEPDVVLVNAGLDGRGVERVFECCSDAPLSDVAVVFHARQLKAMWAKSELLLAGRILVDDAGKAQSDVSGLVAGALQVVDRVSASQVGLSIVYPAEFLGEYVVEMASKPAFMPSCWRWLNKLIGGWRDSGFYVIAGRPGQGKTIVALQAAFELSKQGKHVLYFSLEMPALQLQHRLLAQALSIDYSLIANNELDFEVMNADSSIVWARDLVRDAAESLGNNLGLIGLGRLTPMVLRAYVSAASKVRKVDAVFIDYLGLMHDDVDHRDKISRIGSVSNQLKQFALELQIPVVVAVQLNREVENRTSSKPQLSDLRDSGSIEQDADVVMMIARKKRDGDDPDSHGSDFGLLVVKNRHGQTGLARFVAQDAFSRIVESV